MAKYLIAVLSLVIAMVFDLGMLAYATYVFLAVLLSSRYFAHRWAESLHAERITSQSKASVGQKVAVLIEVANRGSLPVP
ncbi:MAG: hypothetical protein Q4C47_02125 [Planctomycetia bacterium]|nr:hypothetical protein [Planctomycetia bacterium]